MGQRCFFREHEFHEFHESVRCAVFAYRYRISRIRAVCFLLIAIEFHECATGACFFREHEPKVAQVNFTNFTNPCGALFC